MILRSILVVVEALCSLLLIGIILLQKSKSEGLGLAFGAGMGETLFGSRAGNILTKGTILLGIVFLANTLVLGILYSGGERTLMQRYMGPRPVRPAEAGTMRPAGSARPAAEPGGAPTAPPSGAPTLPGAMLDDTPMPPTPPPPQLPAEEAAEPEDAEPAPVE